MVLADQGGDAIQHVTQLLRRGHCLELAFGQLEGQVQVTPMADVDYGRRRTIPHQQVTDHQPAGLALPQTLAAAVTWLSPGRSPPD